MLAIEPRNPLNTATIGTGGLRSIRPSRILGATAPDPWQVLTERERDVLALVAEGWSNEAIGDHLAVTTRTVETHMAHIFCKLGLEPEPGNHRRVLAVLVHLRARVDEGSER